MLAYLVDHCDPQHPQQESQCPDRDGWRNLCNVYYGEHTSIQHCYSDLHNKVDALDSTAMVLVAFGIPVVLLQCLSFCWGWSLFNALKEGNVIHVPAVQFSTRPLVVQPVQC